MPVDLAAHKANEAAVDAARKPNSISRTRKVKPLVLPTRANPQHAPVANGYDSDFNTVNLSQQAAQESATAARKQVHSHTNKAGVGTGGQHSIARKTRSFDKGEAFDKRKQASESPAGKGKHFVKVEGGPR